MDLKEAPVDQLEELFEAEVLCEVPIPIHESCNLTCTRLAVARMTPTCMKHRGALVCEVLAAMLRHSLSDPHYQAVIHHFLGHCPGCGGLIHECWTIQPV